ncbi:hypothetical protein [Streptomyces zhihengii]
MTNTVHDLSPHLRRLEEAHASGGRQAALEAFVDVVNDDMTKEEVASGAARPLVDWLRSDSSR